MGVTLKQVAARSKLAISTVADILGKRAHLYREDTRQRVREAARKLGYRPNASARSVRSGRFDCLCLLQSAEQWRGYLPQSMLQGFQEAMYERGMHLTICTLPDDKLSDETYVPKILRELMADGLLVNYIDAIPKHLTALIRRNDVPSVWINVKHDSDCIHPDDYGAARAATEWLLASGRTRVAYVDLAYLGHGVGHYSRQDRKAGCLEAIEAAGREPVFLSTPIRTPQAEMLRFALEALSKDDRPTGLVAYGPEASTAFLGAATFLGMSLPRDLGIVTFHEHDLAVARGEPVGTAVLDWRRLGSEAVEMLLQKIHAPKKPIEARALELELALAGAVGGGGRISGRPPRAGQ